jgi:uncharacterized RDD family membrane protein YckC
VDPTEDAGDEGDRRITIDVSHLDLGVRRYALRLMSDGGVDPVVEGDAVSFPSDRLDEVQAILERAVDAHPLGPPANDGLASPERRLAGWLAQSLVFTVVDSAAIGLTGDLAVVEPVNLVLAVANGLVAVTLFGRTLGMALTGTRVVRQVDGAPPGGGTATVRWLVAAGPTLVPARLMGRGWWAGMIFGLLWSVAVFGPILIDPFRRGLHDRAAGTLVVPASSAGTGASI